MALSSIAKSLLENTEFLLFLGERIGRDDEAVKLRLEQGLLPYLELKSTNVERTVPSPEVGTAFDLACQFGMIPKGEEHMISLSPDEYLQQYSETRDRIEKLLGTVLDREIWPLPSEFHPGGDAGYKC